MEVVYQKRNIFFHSTESNMDGIKTSWPVCFDLCVGKDSLVFDR